MAFPRDENAYLQLTLKLDGTPLPYPKKNPKASSKSRDVRRALALRGRARAAAAWSDAAAQERGPAVDARPRRSARRSINWPISTTPRASSRRDWSAAAPPRRRFRRLLQAIAGAQGRLRSLPQPGAADRLQRSARRRSDARGHGLAERSPARSGLRLLRAASRSRVDSAVPRRAREGNRRLRAAGDHPGAGRGRRRSQGARRAARRRDARRRFFPQHGDRSARRLQARLRHRQADRDRQARRSAAGRCGDGAGEDWRQAGAGGAGGVAAHAARKELQPTLAAAICLLGVNCSSHLGYLDKGPRRSPTTIPVTRSWCARRRRPCRHRHRRATPTR